MKNASKWICLSALIVFASGAIVSASPQSATAPRTQTTGYPKIQIYTQPGCKSCAAASEYLTSNNIPFIKKDISLNNDYVDEMAVKYKSRAVPVIVIGNDEKVLRGFVQEAFQMAVREVMAKHRN